MPWGAGWSTSGPSSGRPSSPDPGLRQAGGRPAGPRAARTLHGVGKTGKGLSWSLVRRHLVPAVLAVVAVACTAVGIGVGPDGAGATTASAPAPAPAAPVLSPRRVPSLLAQPIGTARLIQALQGLADSVPASACLLVTEGARVLFERAADQPLAPASGMKLLTAAAVIERLGPDQRLRTDVVAAEPPVEGVVEGDLWLVGGGDPVLGTAAWAASFPRQPQLYTSLEDLADRVVAAGVREVRGRVMGDDSRYDRVRYVTTWPERYVADNEIGPLSALSVNDGFAEWEPKAVAFVDPPAGAAGVLGELLRQRGVAVAGEPGAGAAPTGARAVAGIDSPTIAQLVGQMLRESDNGTAELLVKELGVRERGSGTTASGTEVVAASLAAMGLPTGGVAVRDGSGLDPANRASCRLLHDLLAAGDDGPVDDGLPVAGSSGTLSRRFLDFPVSGRIRAKTGSLRGVASLSGFAATLGGFELTFSSIVNGVDRFDDGLPLQDALGTALVRYPDLPSLDEIGPSGYAEATSQG